MTTSFSCPREYLIYLQTVYGKFHPPGSSDREFESITEAQLTQIDSSLSKLGQFGGLHLAIDALTNDVFRSLDRKDVDRISTDIAIGVLPSGEGNAFIAKSPDGKFAVVLCSGLMLLLHKYFKLVRAFVAPEDVIHCNRKPASDLTKDDLSSYIGDLIEMYRAHSAPYGPMIKLSDRATIEHSLLLHLAELFILCHELGHFFNGDLADLSAYSPLATGADGHRYEEYQSHEIEHLADITGFGLYIRVVNGCQLDTSSMEVLKPILAMFNLFYALAGGASSTHPHPYDRVVRIVTHHYGPSTGQQIAAALSNPAILPTFFESGRDGPA